MEAAIEPVDQSEYVELYDPDGLYWQAKVADTRNPDAWIEMTAPIEMRCSLSEIANC